MFLSVGIARIVVFLIGTYVDQLFGVLAWWWALNKSWSSSYVEQILFMSQELIQYLAWSNQAHKIESSAVLKLRKSAKSGMTEILDFVSMYLPLVIFSLQIMSNLAKLI